MRSTREVMSDLAVAKDRLEAAEHQISVATGERTDVSFAHNLLQNELTDCVDRDLAVVADAPVAPE